MGTRETRDGLTFARQVPAGESDQLAHEVEEPATVESVQTRIYQGAENTLRLRLYHIADGSRSRLIEHVGDPDAGGGGTKDYIDGDDDDYRWDVSVPVERGDTLVVDHENTDGSNAHNYRVNMDVDHLGGSGRLLAGLRSVLGRVL